MPLHSPTLRLARLANAAAIATATACMAAGAATVAIADDQPVPQGGTVAETAFTRYFDIEANKAASMRALGRHIAEQRTNQSSRYHDLEANKARSRRALTAATHRHGSAAKQSSSPTTPELAPALGSSAEEPAVVGAISLVRLSQSRKPSGTNLDRFCIRATSRRLT